MVRADAPGGLCPACLLRGAEEAPVSGEGGPSLEEVAAAFPELEILGLIGRGGMGVVYKVRQPALDRVVALKILLPELGRDPAFAERFAREARVLGKLKHPHIVTIHDHGESGGFFYLLMEYVDGVNLRQAMRAGRFTPEQALALVPGICDALQAAHAQGIWHRDIKPENILLDAEGGVKIADFGIARLVGDPVRDFTLTRTGSALGSAAYMAPEQHEKPHEVDHRADIYSLGVVIYEMLTGELPLGRFPEPSRRAEVNARIDQIVMRALEKERELRQQSAGEVKTEVESAGDPSGPMPRGSAGTAREGGGDRVAMDRGTTMTAWAVGLWLGGAAAVMVGAFTAPWLMGLGAVAALVGLVGCGWILRRIRAGLHPESHRDLLLWVACRPAVAGVAYVMVMNWFIFFKRGAMSSPAGENEVMSYAVMALVIPLAAGLTIWKFLGPVAEVRSFEWRRMSRGGLAVLIATGAVALARWVTVRDAQYASYQSMVVQLHGDLRETEDLPLVRKALEEALGDQREHYRATLHGFPGTAPPPARWQTPVIVLESASRDRAESIPRWDRIGERLRALLPKRIGVNMGPIRLPRESNLPEEIGEAYGRVRMLNVVLVLAPIVLVLLLSPLGMAGAVSSGVLAVLVAMGLKGSNWPGVPRGLPPSSEGLEPLARLALPDYDFSTTREAMESLIRAAKRKDSEAFQRGVSKRLLEATEREGAGWDEAIRDWEALAYGGQVDRSGDHAWVSLKNQKSGRSVELPLVWEDGNWKLDLPDSDSRHPNPTAREAMERLIRAAREGDRVAFEEGFSHSLKEMLKASGRSVEEDIERFRGLRVVGEIPVDGRTMEMRVESPDGSFTSFRMILEDGAWKMTEHGR